MSGIAGAVALGDAPLDPAVSERMLHALAYRGPDGLAHWSDATAGLAHALFRTTPEGARERQPVASADGGVRAVSDARLDNRGELIPLLRQAGRLESASPSDGELVLAAYLHWGSECARRVIGDFAFAVWDARRRTFYAARDPLGMRPLFHAVHQGVLYFGTTIAAVLAGLPERPPLNRALIEHWLWRSYDPLIRETVYAGVERLPPAYELRVDGGQVASRRYYTLGEHGEACRTEGERREAFRHLLSEAVRARLRSVTPVGALGCGGLDSSAVTGTARALRRADPNLPELRLYANLFPGIEGADEADFFRALAEHYPDLPATEIPSDVHHALRDLGREGGWPLDEPEVHGLRAHLGAAFRAAAADGCRVVLSGEGGDQVLGSPQYYFSPVLRGVPWWELPAEWPHFLAAHRRRGGALALLWGAYLRPWLPERRRLALLRVRRLLGGDRARRSWRVRGFTDLPTPGATVASAFPPLAGIPPGAELVQRLLCSGYEIARFNLMDEVAARAGVEWRCPLLDRRLVDFLVRLPDSQRARRGLTRIVLREAMRDILPEKIRRRTSKANLEGLYLRGLREEREKIAPLLRSPIAGELGFVRGAELPTALEASWREVVPFIFLEAWLREQTNAGAIVDHRGVT